MTGAHHSFTSFAPSNQLHSMYLKPVFKANVTASQLENQSSMIDRLSHPRQSHECRKLTHNTESSVEKIEKPISFTVLKQVERSLKHSE